MTAVQRTTGLLLTGDGVMSNAKKLMQGASGVSTGGKTVAIVTGADNAAAIDISDVTNMSLISSVTIEAALSQWSALARLTIFYLQLVVLMTTLRQ